MKISLTSDQLELIDSCRNLAFKLANRYSGKNPVMDREDIEQEAMVGLVEAAIRFDPHRGIKFTTYCYPWIVKHILSFIERNISRGCRPERHQVEKFLYGQMDDDESEKFIEVFVHAYSLDQRLDSDDSGDSGFSDDYDFIQEDYVRSVAAVADKVLSGLQLMVFVESVMQMLLGSDEPISEAAFRLGLEDRSARLIFRQAADRIRKHLTECG